MERKSLVVLILMIAACVAAGVLGAYSHKRNIVEVLYRDVTVTEDIVFDDDETVEKYGGAVTIPAGMTGTIRNMVNSKGDAAGEGLIRAEFKLDDGTFIMAAIPADPDADTGSYRFVIDVNKIESGQMILSEYRQTRETYKTRVRNTWVLGILTGIVSAILLTAFFVILNRQLLKQNKSTAIVFRLLIDVAIIAAVVILFEYLTLLYI